MSELNCSIPATTRFNGGNSSAASAIGGGAYSVTYHARHVSRGVATGGNVEGVATYSMEYF